MKYFFSIFLSIFLLVPTATFAASVDYVGTAFKTGTKSYAVISPDGEVLMGKNINDTLPIASLTKLTTAMVLLDNGLDFNGVVAYDKDKHYAYRNYMNFAQGDEIAVRDLWYSMLTGSMNIPVRMMVEYQGYTDEQFVGMMNEKARSLGLMATEFYDVSGLDERNVSNAFEISRVLHAALQYPEIADGLSRAEYAFAEVTSQNKSVDHYFTHTNILMRKKISFDIVASKTGYTYEAGPCIAMQVVGSDGNPYYVITLGESNYYKRYLEIPKLLSATERHVATLRAHDYAFAW